MKNIECKNCGSTEFKTDSNGIICLYCGTPYIEEEKEQIETVVVRTKLSNKAILWTIFGIVCMFFIGVSVFSSMKSQYIIEVQKASPDSTLSQEEYGYKYIKDAGGWNKHVYDDIKIAKRQLNEDGKWKEYSDGLLYTDLIQQVGVPSSLHEDEDENKVTAIWTQNPTSHHILWIHIKYDKQTGMIVKKNIEGWAANP
ncbi:hypothetical protein A5819_000064 [Enterococcus sp. 7E2_DIV0204]|uniref:hypothetical protein n=1 Tax=unclassified Enterococcus TaxID=2608891 RepID=UPI000A34CA15|nr:MULTISPECIES: hypothetical protein [unclassified Enterococcus]OTN87618.1 hypothetical protein A5819_000064 [Enterococcus sp. 7E2_DIV0204]OTP49702.1 hypothetical protein A5884_002902 [Enterococcus sp. 7D2_DIV0200]